MVTRVIVYTLLLVLNGVSAIPAADGVPPPEQLVVLFLKIITYDQSFQFDSTKTVTIYLPYRRSNPESYEQMLAVQKFFEKNEGLTVEGARVRWWRLRLMTPYRDCWNQDALTMASCWLPACPTKPCAAS